MTRMPRCHAGHAMRIMTRIMHHQRTRMPIAQPRPSRPCADGEVCETCGHSHAPDPALLSGDRFDWRTAWSAVAAVGIRPCSGALIVLSFAFLNGLWAGGILSVLAMAVGTAITVSVLATHRRDRQELGGRASPATAAWATASMWRSRSSAPRFVLVVGLLLLSASLMA